MNTKPMLVVVLLLASSTCYADQCDEQTREYARHCIAQYGQKECASHIADMESVCRSGQLQGGRQINDWERQEIIRGLNSLPSNGSLGR